MPPLEIYLDKKRLQSECDNVADGAPGGLRDHCKVFTPVEQESGKQARRDREREKEREKASYKGKKAIRKASM